MLFRSVPVLVMVAAHSRRIEAVMVPSRRTGDLLAGMWLLLQRFGGVPKRLLWDNEAGIGRRGRLADGVSGFCGTLGTKLVQAKPYDPETKGVVERANQYLETSFLPGRSFTAKVREIAPALPVVVRTIDEGDFEALQKAGAAEGENGGHQGRASEHFRSPWLPNTMTLESTARVCHGRERQGLPQGNASESGPDSQGPPGGAAPISPVQSE